MSARAPIIEARSSRRTTHGTGPAATLRREGFVVSEGIVLSRYFIIMLVICGGLALAGLIHRGTFESKRWEA